MRPLGNLASVLALLTCVLLLTGTDAAQAASKRDHANCDLGVVATGDSDTIIASCSRIVSDRRESPKSRAEAYSIRSLVYSRARDYDRVIADASEAIRLMPREDLYYTQRGQAYFEKGDEDRAIADFSEAIRLQARSPRYHGYLHRGAVYLRKGDYDRAIADHSRAIELDPTSPMVYGRRGIGLVRYFKGDFKGAAADFKRAIDLDADDYATDSEHDLHILLFRYLASERAGEKAAAELEATARLLRSGEWPYPAIELYLGRRTPAATIEAAGTAEERCEAHFYVGMWHLLKGDSAAAEKGLASARDTCPKNFSEYGAAVAELARLQAAATAVPAAPARVKPAPPGPAAAPNEALELEFWRSVKDSGNPAMLHAYLDKFPEGSFAPLARIKLKELSEGTRP